MDIHKTDVVYHSGSIRVYADTVETTTSTAATTVTTTTATTAATTAATTNEEEKPINLVLPKQFVDPGEDVALKVSVTGGVNSYGIGGTVEIPELTSKILL